MSFGTTAFKRGKFISRIGIWKNTRRADHLPMRFRRTWTFVVKCQMPGEFHNARFNNSHRRAPARGIKQTLFGKHATVRNLPDAVEAHRGRLIKSMGDGWLLDFPSAKDAVGCAIKVQKALQEHERIKLRIGLHVGAGSRFFRAIS